SQTLMTIPSSASVGDRSVGVRRNFYFRRFHCRLSGFRWSVALHGRYHIDLPKQHGSGFRTQSSMLLPAGDISLPGKTNMRITPKRASLLSRLTCGHPFLAGGLALIAALGVQPLLT